MSRRWRSAGSRRPAMGSTTARASIHRAIRASSSRHEIHLLGKGKKQRRRLFRLVFSRFTTPPSRRFDASEGRRFSDADALLDVCVVVSTPDATTRGGAEMSDPTAPGDGEDAVGDLSSTAAALLQYTRY